MIYRLLFISCILLLAACGGGSSSDSSTPADTTPNSFNFSSKTDTDIATLVESESISITGIDAAASISIAGGEYSIDGNPYTSSASTITNGQSVTVRLTSENEGGLSTSATLTVGGINGVFTATTFIDITPDPFTFNTQQEVPLNFDAESNGVVVSGLNTAAEISVSDGEYSINGNPFTSETSLVNNGDTVVVRQTTSSVEFTLTTATLSIGDVDRGFSVRTHFATPIGEIKFPPAVSQTDGHTITIRGNAFSTVASPIDTTIVSVEISSPLGTIPATLSTSSSSNIVNWSAEVPLEMGQNVLTIDVMDGVSNRDAIADTIAITRIEHPLSRINVIRPGIRQNKVYFLDSDLKIFFELDLVTKERVPISKNGVPDRENLFYDPQDFVIDHKNRRALLIDNPYNYYTYGAQSGAKIIEIDLDTGVRKVFASHSVPNSILVLQTPMSIAIDVVNNRALVADLSLDAIVAIDLDTKQRTILSDNSTPNSSGSFDAPWSIALPVGSDFAYVYDTVLNVIFSVDLINGTRKILSAPVDLGGSSLIDQFRLDRFGIDYTGNRLIASTSKGRVIEVNTQSGQVQDIKISAGATGSILLIDDTAYIGYRNQIVAEDINSSSKEVFITDGPLEISNDRFSPTAITKPILGTAYVLNWNNSLYSMDIETGELTMVWDEANFPQQSEFILFGTDITHDVTNNQILVANYHSFISAIDLATGEWKVVSQREDQSLLVSPTAIAMGPNLNQAIVTNFGSIAAALMGLDTLSGAKTAISGIYTTPAPAEIGNPTGLAIDLVNLDAYIVLKSSRYPAERKTSLIRTDISSGNSFLISNNSFPNGENPFVNPVDLVLSGSNAFVLDSATQQLIETNLNNGVRLIRSDGSAPNSFNLFGNPTHAEKYIDFVYVSDPALRAIVVVDLVTNQRVMIGRELQ